MRLTVAAGLVIVLSFILSACAEEDQPPPPPASLTSEAMGYYCNMTVADHQGPKGQIRLNSRDETIWFTSVRDTIAFTLLPEEPKDISVIYVTDMSGEGSWDNPPGDNWIDAATALFVIGSSKKGGMGAPEPVPFATKEAAAKFAGRYGGRVVGFADIPEEAILGAVEIDDMDMKDSAEHNKKGND